MTREQIEQALTDEVLEKIYDVSERCAQDAYYDSDFDRSKRISARLESWRAGILAALPPEPQRPETPKYGSEVLCAFCAVVFCPHMERLHFHHDGCPACHATAGEVEQASAEQAWRPIEEYTLTDGEPVQVLLANDAKPVPITATCGAKHRRWISVPGGYGVKPTHFRSLPAPPVRPTRTEDRG